MISPKDVHHIADLARIELTPEEEQKFTEELAATLEFVEKLNAVETSAIEPLAGGTSLENIMRPDGAAEKSLEEKSAEIIAAAPETKDGWVKVKSVFE